jgi:hypothetical protein
MAAGTESHSIQVAKYADAESAVQTSTEHPVETSQRILTRQPNPISMGALSFSRVENPALLVFEHSLLPAFVETPEHIDHGVMVTMTLL